MLFSWTRLHHFFSFFNQTFLIHFILSLKNSSFPFILFQILRIVYLIIFIWENKQKTTLNNIYTYNRLKITNIYIIDDTIYIPSPSSSPSTNLKSLSFCWGSLSYSTPSYWSSPTSTRSPPPSILKNSFKK